MKIEVLGTGCAKCIKLAEHAKAAATAVGNGHTVEKVEDIAKIVGYGVMTTPALVVDGVVKSTGKLLSSEEIEALLR